MNPFACRIVLRPRSPFESLDLALCLLREDAGLFARLMLVVLLPVALILAPTVAYPTSHDWDAVRLALLVLAAPALQVPFTQLIARRLFDDKVRVRDALRGSSAGWRAYPLVALSTLVSLTLATFSLGMLWLPAHAGTLWVVEAAALERLSIPRALARSVALSSNGVGKAVVGSLVSGALLMWVVLGTELMAQGLVQFVLQLGQPFGSIQNGDVTPWMFAGVLLAQPLIALYRMILYVDLRTAVEGWDVQVAMMAAAERA